MSEIEEVQEQMKADMESMKDQMTSMMEAMLSMRWMMEDNAAAVVATSAATEADPTHPSSINQTSRPIPNMVGRGGEVLGRIGSPHMVQNKNSFPPYGLPPHYTLPNAVHVPNENANHSVPIPLEG